MILASLLLLVGFAILIKGADFMVGGAASLAKKFNISNLAIGLTVVAFGTSAPELVVNLISSLNDKNDAAFGNVIGSNNFNILLILGLAGTIYPLVVQRNTVKYEVPISILAIFVLYILVNDQLIWGSGENGLTRVDAIILLCFFGLFMFYIYRTMRQSLDDDADGDVKQFGNLKSVGLIILGLAMLVGGGKLVVDNSIEIALYYGLSEKLIGLTILAVGTSLPELATTAVAAYRKHTDIAIGNVVGSNIFNIFFILGITGTISPLTYNVAFNTDIYILVAATVMLMIFMFTINQRKLDRWEAVILFCGYIVYTLYLVNGE